jgi:hypothetical protein
MTKIYLVENCYGDSNKVYLGKTKNNRYNNHKSRFGDSIKYTVIDEIESLDKEDWKPLESYWILQFKVWGFNVLNKNKGGGGPSYLTDEQKKNYSYPKTQPFINSVIGKSKNYPESRNKNISKSLKGYKQTKEHIKKRTKNLKGKPNIKNQTPKPEGFGEKISQKLKGKKIPSISKPILQYDLEGNYIREFGSITEACYITFNDISKNPNITKCCKGKIKTAYGFIWKYKIVR